MKKTASAPIGSLAAIEAALQSIIHLLATVAANAQAAAADPEPDYSELNYRTVKEAAKALGMSPDRVYQLVYRDDFPSYKVGDRWYIPKAELAEWNSKQAKEKAEL